MWSQADRRPQALDVFEDNLAQAIADAWADVEDGLVISSVPVSGGTSVPGGPLTGASATLSPGTLTATASFTTIATRFSCTFPDRATEELRALVSAVSNGLGQKFLLWATGYSTTLTALGGTCAWVAPAPPANPTGTPGPWTGGSIQPSPLSGGTSTGDQGMTAGSLEAAIGDAADASKLKQNQGQLQPALSALIKAISAGFETTWNQWKSTTMITGGTGTGIASPPSGATAGTVTTPQIS